MALREDGGCVTAASSSSANPFPPPSAKCVINEGAVSGVLPVAVVLAIHYPGYPTSTSRAIKTLGGIPRIAKAWSCAIQNLGGNQDLDKDRRRFLKLKFRPEDPFCHPAFGEPRPSSGLLLRISRSRTGDSNAALAEQLSADVVSRVSLAYNFEGMADYQHVVAVHAAESRRRKRSSDLEDELHLGDNGKQDMDLGDLMMLVPPLFARKDKPDMIVLNLPASLSSDSMQKAVVEYNWEMDIEPCHAIPFSTDRIPEEINWEDKLPKGTVEWKAHVAAAKLFEERPIWPRWSLHERLVDDGVEVTDYLLRRLLLRTGYYFSQGPFGRFWIRKGYDPRGNPESRIYQKVDFRVPPNLRDLNYVNAVPELKQKWKDICRFQKWPSKALNYLQLFELDDDYIQEEISKPTNLTTCSPFTGWFSKEMLKALRLRVMIRFLSVAPKGAPEEFLKSKIEDFKRCRKKDALSKFGKPVNEHCPRNQDADDFQEPPVESQNEDIAQDENNAHEIENEAEEYEEEEEEEEEEEVLDGFESPLMVDGEGDCALPYNATPYYLRKSIPSEYLQELLCGFQSNKDGEQQQPCDEAQDLSDDEFQIYEQDSEGEDD